jgi:hypothetical protein
VHLIGTSARLSRTSIALPATHKIQNAFFRLV